MLTRLLQRMRGRAGSAGFSQIEFLVSTATVSLMFAGLHQFYRSQVFTVRTEEVVINLKQEVDVGIDFLVKELRSAGARPEAWPTGGCGTFTKPATCASFERIVLAGPTEVIFQYDYDGTGSLPDGCPSRRNERVRYFLTGGEIRRTTAGETGTLVDNVPVGGFRLDYFDGDGLPLTPEVATGLLSTADRERVASVAIRVEASEANPTPSMSNTFSSSRETRVFLRNERHC